MKRLKHIIMWVMAGLLLTSCTDDYDELGFANKDNLTESVGSTTGVFEGVWNIDGVSLPATYTVALYQLNGQTRAVFTSFPYHAVAEQLVEPHGDFSVTEPAEAPTLVLASVGYSGASDYKELATSDSDNGDRRQELTFTVNTVDGQQLTVVLGLMPTHSTFAIGSDALSCILAVKRLTTIDADQQQHRRIFNPERLLTFTSIKRTK